MELTDGALARADEIERSYGPPVLALRLDTGLDRPSAADRARAAIALLRSDGDVHWSVDVEPAAPAAAPTAAPAAAPTAAERAAEPKVPCCSSSCDSFSSSFLSSCWFSSAIFLLLSAPALRAGAAASAPPSPRRRGETIRCSTAPCTFAGRRIGHGCAERRRNGVNRVGDRTQRLKGKANEAAGKKKGAFGYETGNAKTEAKGAAQTVKGKAQQAAGKARSTAKKKTR